MIRHNMRYPGVVQRCSRVPGTPKALEVKFSKGGDL